MTGFANQSEKVEILQCKNGMLPKKLGFLFLTVLERFRKQFWKRHAKWWKNPRGPNGFSKGWPFLSQPNILITWRLLMMNIQCPFSQPVNFSIYWLSVRKGESEHGEPFGEGNPRYNLQFVLRIYTNPSVKYWFLKALLVLPRIDRHSGLLHTLTDTFPPDPVWRHWQNQQFQSGEKPRDFSTVGAGGKDLSQHGPTTQQLMSSWDKVSIVEGRSPKMYLLVNTCFLNKTIVYLFVFLVMDKCTFNTKVLVFEEIVLLHL